MNNLFIFLDEGGNFDFKSTGTKYFSITAVSSTNPYDWFFLLTKLKYFLIQEFDLDLEYFHATEDKQHVRDRVFAIINSTLSDIYIDSVIIEKRKTGPALQPIEKFYPRMIGYLIQYILNRYASNDFDKFIIITDRIPNNKKRQVIEKAIKLELVKILPKGKKYLILHHAAMSCIGIQVADYCNWAIFRKWEKEDNRSYQIIEGSIKSCFDIFKNGKSFYY